MVLHSDAVVDGFIFRPENNDATYRTVAHELGKAGNKLDEVTATEKVTDASSDVIRVGSKSLSKYIKVKGLYGGNKPITDPLIIPKLE